MQYNMGNSSEIDSNISVSSEDSFPKSNSNGTSQQAREKRIAERKLINPFEPSYMDIMQKADRKQDLNGSAPEELKKILSPFLPHYTKKQVYQPKIKHLSRYQRKLAAKMSYEKTVISHASALQKVLEQIQSSIDEGRINLPKEITEVLLHPIDFSVAAQIKEEQKIIKKSEYITRKEFFYNTNHAGIPERVFFTTPLEQLQEIVSHYQTNKDESILAKNYATDMMRHKIIPLYQDLKKGDYAAQNIAFTALSDLFYNACLSQNMLLGNVHPNHISTYMMQTNFASNKDLYGALTQAYGTYIFDNLSLLSPTSNFVCNPIVLDEKTRIQLDLTCKTDAVYNITMPDGKEVIRCIDFKNEIDTKTNIARKEMAFLFDSHAKKSHSKNVTSNTYDRLIQRIRVLLQEQEKPIMGLTMYMGLQGGIGSMHFTPSMIQSDVNHFYNQLVQASTNSSFPIQ